MAGLHHPNGRNNADDIHETWDDLAAAYVGCKNERDEKGRHLRVKYTRKDMSKHAARYGLVKEIPMIPDGFTHVKQV